MGFHNSKSMASSEAFLFGEYKVEIKLLISEECVYIITLIYVKQHIREYNSICMSKKNVTPISNVEGRKRFVMET